MDIVHEAYCRIFRLGDPSAVSHLPAYLYQTAKSIATDWIRQRIVREAFAEEQPLRADGEAPSLERIWLSKEEVEALRCRVEALPPKSRLALLMVKLDGASYEEVGAKLGIKAHSAQRLVERAIKYLLEAESQEQLTSNFRGTR
jgi:RNA polymerase sigma factor (sigma-70 family)